MNLTFDTLQKNIDNRVIFRGICGSHAYGTSTPESDQDSVGVFVLEAEAYLSLEETPVQVSDERNDNRFYSLRNFLELASKGNPNILDVLFLPDDCMLTTSQYWRMLQNNRNFFLSQKALQTYCDCARGQMRKTRDCNRRIHNPQLEHPPVPADFCYILKGAGTGMPSRSVPLEESGIRLEQCHAVAVKNSSELYRLYDYGNDARGVFHNGMLVCENVPQEDEGTRFIGLMVYNKSSFEHAKSRYRQYSEWCQTRNKARWSSKETGVLDYDAKNLMHIFRLLYSALNIVECGEPLVRFHGEKLQKLMDIRTGRFDYDTLANEAESLIRQLEVARETSTLPEMPDSKKINSLLLEITRQWKKNHER